MRIFLALWFTLTFVLVWVRPHKNVWINLVGSWIAAAMWAGTVLAAYKILVWALA
jgi:hypothetical protein